MRTVLAAVLLALTLAVPVAAKGPGTSPGVFSITFTACTAQTVNATITRVSGTASDAQQTYYEIGQTYVGGSSGVIDWNSKRTVGTVFVDFGRPVVTVWSGHVYNYITGAVVSNVATCTP